MKLTKTLGMVLAVAVMFAGPAGAAERRDAAEVTSEHAAVAADVARLNALAALSGNNENESCTFGAWAAVNRESVDRPGVVFVYGHDQAASNGDCVNIDPLNAGPYTQVLRTSFEYLKPGTNPSNPANWVLYARSDCRQGSSAGQSVIPACLFEHQFTDKDDEIQTYSRRAHFELFVERNGVLTLKAERYFGPIIDPRQYIETAEIACLTCR